MKYFFWIAFAVFLAASIPHVAYFFASFEPSQGSTGVWWWVVSYAIAISIDVYGLLVGRQLGLRETVP